MMIPMTYPTWCRACVGDLSRYRPPTMSTLLHPSGAVNRCSVLVLVAQIETALVLLSLCPFTEYSYASLAW
jgi:hypothetical protein